MRVIVIQFLINMAMGLATAFLTVAMCKRRLRRTGCCPICGIRDRLHGLDEEEQGGPDEAHTTTER